MALLRIPLGCLTATILRLALLAAIGIAAYLLLARPLLEKADDAIRTSGVGAIGRTIEGLDRPLQRRVRQALGTARRGGADLDAVLGCLRRAGPDVSRVERCTGRL